MAELVTLLLSVLRIEVVEPWLVVVLLPTWLVLLVCVNVVLLPLSVLVLVVSKLLLAVE
jgi:hypothetical protein